jgi:protein-tyrosine phosphatase
MSRWFRTYGFQEVYDDLVIGAVPTDEDDVAALDWIGVRRVLNLVENAEYEPGAREMVKLAYDHAGIEERRLSLVDFGRLPAAALDEAFQIVQGWLDEGHTTYVHCRAGFQRSASVAATVVAVRPGLDIDEAVRLVRSRKPTADPLPHQREDLRRWWSMRQHAGA